MRRSRFQFFLPVVLLAAALALVTGLAACGSEKGGGKSADEILNDAFSEKGKKVKSGKLDLTVNIDLQGAPDVKGPIKASLGGAFQDQGKGEFPQLDLQVNASAQGQSFDAGLVTTGSQAFVEFKGQAYEVPAELYDQFKQGFERAQAQQTTTATATNPLALLGINPRNWLKDAKVEDDTDVKGTETYHVSASVDVTRMLDDISKAAQENPQLGGATGGQVPSLTDEQKKQVEDSVESATFDVYVGADDDIIRKLDVKVKIALPSDLQQQADGLKGGSFGFDVTLSDLNKSQTITAPSNTKPLDELLTQFGIPAGSLGQLGSGGFGDSSGGTTTTPGGTTTTPGDEQTQAYLECLQDAKTSSELQACNDLLK